MRILIVDDDPQKLSVVRAFLTENGIDIGDISTAGHAAEARILLDKAFFDVLLIDVLLPARRGAIPRGQDSIELLRQIVEDGTTPAPRYILGMTASLDAQASFQSEFRSLVTHVLHVAPGEGLWRQHLLTQLNFARRVESSEVSNDYDVCVLSALRSPELEAVYSSWPLTLGEEFLIGRNVLCSTGTLRIDGTERRVVCGHLSQMGPIASSHAATLLLSRFRPRLLLMTGICGGFADHVNVGDVVVAEKSWDWQAGKWNDEGRLATASDQRNAAAELVAEARLAASSLSKLHDGYSGTKPASSPRLVVGPMVTGSSVVASLDIQKVFRDQHRKMVGVDMECYGLYYAAENCADALTRVICIKSVSDLADRAKGDDFQIYCSHMSALIALDVVRRFFTREGLNKSRQLC